MANDGRMPDQSTAATRSIIVGVCLCLLAFAILVGYSVLASHQIGPGGSGVAATTNKRTGGSLTFGRSRPSPTAPPRPGRDRTRDQVLGKRIHRGGSSGSSTTAPTTGQPTTSRPTTKKPSTGRDRTPPPSRPHAARRGNPAGGNGSTGDGNDHHRPERREHVPQGHAYGYWRNRGEGSEHSQSSPGNGHGHAYGHYKHDD